MINLTRKQIIHILEYEASDENLIKLLKTLRKEQEIDDLNNEKITLENTMWEYANRNFGNKRMSPEKRTKTYDKYQEICAKIAKLSS